MLLLWTEQKQARRMEDNAVFDKSFGPFHLKN